MMRNSKGWLTRGKYNLLTAPLDWRRLPPLRWAALYYPNLSPLVATSAINNPVRRSLLLASRHYDVGLASRPATYP